MSLDASDLLDSLTLIDYKRVTARSSMQAEMSSRAYSKITSYLMEESGCLMTQEVMIYYFSLKERAI
jgi:hypothetical protein